MAHHFQWKPARVRICYWCGGKSLRRVRQDYGPVGLDGSGPRATISFHLIDEVGHRDKLAVGGGDRGRPGVREQDPAQPGKLCMLEMG